MNAPPTLITGGGRGLGRAGALHLARAGHDLLLTYLSRKDEAEAVAAEVRSLGRRALVLHLDTGRPETFDAFAAQVKPALAELGVPALFALVNNAGHGLHALFPDTTEAQFDQLMAVHLKGPYFLTQKLLPLLADGGRIVNLSTGLARFSLPGYSAYAAMKGGVEVLTRYLAKELGSRRITVNTLAPGAIETDFGGGVVRDNPAVNAFIASQTALCRAGLPDDVGGALALLLSEGAGWITGQRIEVSGGMCL